jgi:hypothetical protein
LNDEGVPPRCACAELGAVVERVIEVTVGDFRKPDVEAD